jgi:hypothetical protein
MLEVLTLVLPVVWAIAATVVGLILYKTSAALFESKTTDKTRSKRIRLTGSVTIAALSFVGMWYATPSERLKSADMATLRAIAADIDRESLEMAACSSTRTCCMQEVEKVRALAGQLVRTLQEGTSDGSRAGGYLDDR